MNEKPPFLFHGSCKGIVGPLVPRPQHGNINGDFPEGVKPVVFATDNATLAALYALKTPHMLSAGSCNGQNFSFFRDYEGWKNELATSPCHVYTLPSATFTNTIGKHDGKPTIEWQSQETVMPVNSVRVSPEDVMRMGTQLFFLDARVSPDIWHYDPKKPADATFMNRITAKMNAGILTPQSFTGIQLAGELMDAGIVTHLNALTGLQPVAIEKSPRATHIQEDIDWLKQRMRNTTVVRDPESVIGPKTAAYFAQREQPQETSR